MKDREKDLIIVSLHTDVIPSLNDFHMGLLMDDRSTFSDDSLTVSHFMSSLRPDCILL